MRAYRADRAFDGTRALPGGVLVLVDEGRIAGVEPASAAAPDGCEVVQFPGATLLPGLIDTHVHLCGDSGLRALDQVPELSADELERVIATAEQQHLRAGVTAVRDLGDHRWAVLDRIGTDGLSSAARAHRRRLGAADHLARRPLLVDGRGGLRETRTCAGRSASVPSAAPRS